MKIRKSPAEVAKLLVINACLYEQEKQKELNRFRVSYITLRKIAGRKRLREAFLADLEYELFEIGWKFFELETPEYALINIIKTNSWMRISSKRLQENGYIDLDENEIDKVFEQFSHEEVLEDNED